MIKARCDCYLQDTCKKFAEGNCNSLQDTYCPRISKVDYLYDQALIPVRQRKRFPLRPDPDGTDREQFKQLKQAELHIEDFIDRGANLLIYSPWYGNGKTSWAIRLLQAHIENIWYKTDLRCRGLFVSVPRCMLAMKNSISNVDEYAQHIEKNILDADIVIFDDIATKGMTQYEMEKLFPQNRGSRPSTATSTRRSACSSASCTTTTCSGKRSCTRWTSRTRCSLPSTTRSPLTPTR